MKEMDTPDHLIDEALRLAASGQPPAGYLDRLHRRIEATPETHGARDGSRIWIVAGCVAAAVLFAVLLPVLRHPSKSTGISAIPTNKAAKVQPDSRTSLTASTTEAPVRPVSQNRIRHPKNRYVEKRDAANLFNYPLTHQEKLLIQFARTATPDELKALNPEYQAKVEAQQEAEFAAYVKSGSNSRNSSESSMNAEP